MQLKRTLMYVLACGLTSSGGVDAVVMPPNMGLARAAVSVSGALDKSMTPEQELATGRGMVDRKRVSTTLAAQGNDNAPTDATDQTKSGRAFAASPPGRIDPSTFLAADRATTWAPGMMAVGGIPVRSAICSNLTPRGEGRDDRAQIQAAINTCSVGQIVQLGPGTFTLAANTFILINKGITLRGAGPDKTTITKLDGAKPYPTNPAIGASPGPLIIVGPSIYGVNGSDNAGVVGSTDLTADAVKGANSVTVASTTGFSAGQIVLLDEASGAGWQTDPLGHGQIWASSDWRVVWRKHNPVFEGDDFDSATFPNTSGGPGQWFSRLDRPTAEVKEIASVSGNTITFTTPFHISYRTSHAAQLGRYGQPHVKNAGVEDLRLLGGDSDNLRFNWAALSWAKNVESAVWCGTGFTIYSSFRIELRHFYVHDAAWAVPGGGAYAISLSHGTSEVLIEDGISVRANKVMVARSAGAGSVVGYNYMDMGYINYIGAWIEVGLNASHMVGSHHVLFEGNYGHNADSDDTHGNSIYHTFFRNHLRGIRAAFNNQPDGTIDDANQPGNGPKRCAGLMTYSYWMSFVGNVLGASGQMAGWVYETTFGGKPGIWMLGWGKVTDTTVSATALRQGNFDYLTNTVKWDPTIANHTLPNSLYLTEKPAFFDAGSGYTWPWVDPVGATKLYVLPAKARYDAGTPFTQP
jgi:hypothetical protein